MSVKMVSSQTTKYDFNKSEKTMTLNFTITSPEKELSQLDIFTNKPLNEIKGEFDKQNIIKSYNLTMN